MSLEVMHADDGLCQGQAKRVGDARSTQERCRKPGTLGVSNAIEVHEAAMRFAEHTLRQRQHAPDMVARGELGHYAAVDFVQGDLRMQSIREQPAIRVV